MNYLSLLFICLFTLSVFTQETTFQNNTSIADSLDIIGEYDESLKYRELALEEKNHTKDYKIYLKAKWHYTKSCIYETIGGQDNHREALKNSLEAKRLISKITTEQKKYYFFNHQIANRYYHHYKWLGKLEEALIGVNEEYNFLKDTLPEYDIRILYTIDSRGILNTLLEDPERANDYFLWSLPLYKKYHPENLHDIYWNYTEMVVNYRRLGLRNEEYRLLVDSENYWTNISKAENAYYYQNEIYKMLVNWHAYYGNYDVAESYLYKQEKLFDSISNFHKPTEKEDLIIRRLLSINLDYAELFLNKGDFEKAKEALKKLNKLLKNSKSYFRWEVEGKIKSYFFESQLPEKNFQQSEHLLLKAIDLAKTTRESHFIEALPYEIKLYELYVENNIQNKALAKLSDILSYENEVDDNLKFRLLCLKAGILGNTQDYNVLEKEYKTAFSLLLNNPESRLTFSNLKINQLKEFYTYSTLNGILQIANFYLDWHNDTNKKEHVENALNMYLLASDFFGKIYVGDKYNPNLYEYYKKIEKGLVTCTMSTSNMTSANSCIEAIENNASKLTWSKFIYNKSKHSLNITDSILHEELRLKSIINYYQTSLYNVKRENGLPPDSLKHRMTYLKTKLRDHQEYVRKTFGNQYTSNYDNFNVEALQQKLDDNQLVLKFSFIDQELYAYALTKNKSSIHHLSKDIDTILQKFVKVLSSHNSLVEVPKELESISRLLKEFDKDNITIIPSETLNFIPFETLIPNYFESDFVVHYSSSLSLYKEQIDVFYDAQDLQVGIFTGQDKTTLLDVNYLPALTKEINAISNLTGSKVFYQADKTDFLSNASSFNILHLAMHATVDDQNPELSHLGFYNSDLLVGELYNENIQADLAVLSACGTGNGALYKGEGVQSISKAFTFAGVPSTVISLWEVDDKATAFLMSSFYQYLKKGKSKDLALKLAKSDYLNADIDDDLKHPYYWSAFVVSGNTHPLKQNTITHFWWLIVLIIPVAILYFKEL